VNGRRQSTADAYHPWRASQALPGPDAGATARREYVRRMSRTCFHPVGTCRTGTDKLAVVDPDLRSTGSADCASVMPTITTANTNATVLAIAERAAPLISGEAASLANASARTA
jgi:choline dehydrogenase